MYRHTSFYHTSLYCASQVVWFFANWRQDPPPAQRFQLALLPHLLHHGGLEPNPQHLWGMPVFWEEGGRPSHVHRRNWKGWDESCPVARPCSHVQRPHVSCVSLVPLPVCSTRHTSPFKAMLAVHSKSIPTSACHINKRDFFSAPSLLRSLKD